MKKVLLLLIGIIAALSLAACAIEPIRPTKQEITAISKTTAKTGITITLPL